MMKTEGLENLTLTGYIEGKGREGDKLSNVAV